jgi:hypothetical protein
MIISIYTLQGEYFRYQYTNGKNTGRKVLEKTNGPEE